MRKSIALMILTGLFILTSACLAQNTDPVAVLKSDAGFKEKAEACRTLVLKGNQEAIPVLASLLGDEKLAHMARWALEPMPYPEAGAALRDALGKTSGRIKVGLISSLAIRKDEQAVPELIKLLSGADAEVAQTAALALGMIATPEGAKALEEAVAKAGISPGNLKAFCDGLCGCAERFIERGQSEQAATIYGLLLVVPNAPTQAKSAALRGAVLMRGEKALPLLSEAIESGDEKSFEAALSISRELGDAQEVTGALAGALPVIAPERKVRLIEVLGERGGDAAGTALLAAAKEGPEEVRIAAVRALTRIGSVPSIELIAQLAWADDSDLAKAARESLSYFPGEAGDAAIKAMLGNDRVEARRVAVGLIGQGALENPVELLMKTAEGDTDETVRVAALTALQDSAGIDHMPALLGNLLKVRSQPEMQASERVLSGICERQKRMPGGIVIQKATYGALPDGPSEDVTGEVSDIVASGSLAIEASNGNFGEPAPGVVKKLRVDYTQNGMPVSKTVTEGETLKLTVVSAPAGIVDAFSSAFEKAQGEAKLSMLRLLGSTASPKALEIVRAAGGSDDAAVKGTALRTLCQWPAADALPAVMELAKTCPDETLKVLALRGAVRLLGEGAAPASELFAGYSVLMENARTADEKKTVLGGLAELPQIEAFELALSQFGDESVKAEAVQAAIAIAKDLGKSPAEDKAFFNGADLAGWQGNSKYWRFEDGAIVGSSAEAIPQNEFIWSGVEVRDFYLAVDILLEPNTANAGIQFRSKKVDERGQALGYQGDVGQDVWGRLYHEHGRGKLDWTDRAEIAVLPGQWNHYEILAVGPAIWTAVNGKLGTACLDLAGKDERSGLIAVQIHAGAPMSVRYKIKKLVHNPKVELEGLSAEKLIPELKVP